MQHPDTARKLRMRNCSGYEPASPLTNPREPRFRLAAKVVSAFFEVRCDVLVDRRTQSFAIVRHYAREIFSLSCGW
jgi:hypothetical protein